MQIFLRVLACQTAVVDVDDPSTFTVEEVKRVVEQRHGIPCGDQRLSAGGRPLMDHRSLADCGVGK